MLFVNQGVLGNRYKHYIINNNMNLNISTIQGLSDGQLVELAHKSLAIPSIWIALISTWLIFLVAGLILIDRKRSRDPYSKFLLIWFVSVVASAIVGIFLTYSPHLMSSIGGAF